MSGNKVLGDVYGLKNMDIVQPNVNTKVFSI